MKNHCLKRGMS